MSRHGWPPLGYRDIADLVNIKTIYGGDLKFEMLIIFSTSLPV